MASVSRAVVEAERVGGGCKSSKRVLSQLGILVSNRSAGSLILCGRRVVAFCSADKGASESALKFASNASAI